MPDHTKEFETDLQRHYDPGKSEYLSQQTVICPRCGGIASALDAYYGDYYCSHCGQEIQTRILSKGIWRKS